MSILESRKSKYKKLFDIWVNMYMKIDNIYVRKIYLFKKYKIVDSSFTP